MLVLKSIYFDLDDTLIYTKHKFNQAMVDCLQEFNNFFGVDNPHPKNVLDYLLNLETINVETLGFDKGRFPDSMIQTYKYFTDRLGYEYTEQMEQRIISISNKVNEPPFLVQPSAIEVLKTIRPEVDEMFIYTMGSSSVQNEKAKALSQEVLELFNDVIVVSKKDTQTFKSILDKRDPKNCIMVGNSARSDIFPAVKVGSFAVHIPTETWNYDVHPEPFYYNRLYTIPSIKQLPSILKIIQEDI